MKKLLLLLTILSAPSFASGTLTVGQSVVNSGKSRGPTIGLYVYEFISYNWSYQSWTGGVGGQWFSSDHGLMRRINPKLTLGIGPSFESSQGRNNTSLKVYGEFNVW